MNKVFSLCNDVQIFPGHNRTLIVDLTKGKHHLVSKEWSELILKIDGSSKKELFAKSNSEEKETLLEILEFLKSYNYVFEVDKNVKELFKDIEMSFETPFIFDHCFCEVNKTNVTDIMKMIENQKSYVFGGFHFLIYDISDLELLPFKNLINSLDLNKNIEIYTKESKTHIFLEERNRNIIIHKADFINSREMRSNFYEKFPIMNIGMKQILESENFNFFHNKSLFINEKGDIVDSLFTEQPHIHMNIKEFNEKIDSINILLADKSFTKYWHINNSKIIVCKDCEFRRVCIDCRPPVLNANGEWYKEECTYNPYLSQWKN
jgi:hypothetical protein